MKDWMIHETRSQKCGPTAGKSGPTSGSESNHSGYQRAVPTAGEKRAHPTADKNSYFTALDRALTTQAAPTSPSREGGSLRCFTKTSQTSRVKSPVPWVITKQLLLLLHLELRLLDEWCHVRHHRIVVLL